MQEHFTIQAQSAIDGAAAAARKLKHPYIGTEHLLLGLLKEVTGVAGQLLAQYGVEEKKVLRLMDELIAPAAEDRMKKSPQESPRFRFILE